MGKGLVAWVWHGLGVGRRLEGMGQRRSGMGWLGQTHDGPQPSAAYNCRTTTIGRPHTTNHGREKREAREEREK